MSLEKQPLIFQVVSRDKLNLIAWPLFNLLRLIILLNRCTFALVLLTNTCLLTSNSATAADCLDATSDSDGDGWGYENGISCTVSSFVAQPIDASSSCIDTDGDGWGWNGFASCATAEVTNTNTNTNTIVNTAATDSSTVGTCTDNDGDGWGWNGTSSCVVAASAAVVVEPVATVTPVEVTPTVTVQSGTSTSSISTASCRVVLTAGSNLYNAVTGGTGEICLEAGSYSLPESLALSSNQSLRGLDPLNPPVINTSAVRTIGITGQSNIVIENITIDGNGTGATEFGILVGSNSRNVELNNVTIQNTFGIGIGISSSHTVTINDGSIRNIGLDSRLRQAVWVVFGSTNVTIDGLYVRGRENDQAGGDHAITCIDSVDDYTVTNVRSEYAGSGAVAVNNCSNITITNNQLSNGREFGIDIVNGAVGAVVSGNSITGFDRSAMVFDDHSWQCGGCGSNPTELVVSNNQMLNNNLVSLSYCKGISVDQQMVINPSAAQLSTTDWVQIDASNTIDTDSALYCDHIH